VPLSEHEQRLLEQMERALHAEDPRLASAMRNGAGRPIDGRKAFLGGLAFIAGIVALIGGVVTSLVILGVVGFLLMLGGVLIVIAAMRAPVATPDGGRVTSGAASKSQGTGGSPKSGHGFMDRMEERWRNRRDGEGY